MGRSRSAKPALGVLGSHDTARRDISGRHQISLRLDEPHTAGGERRRFQPETAAVLLPLPLVLDNPSRVGTIGDTSYVTIQSRVVADSNDLAGFAVEAGASL